MKTYKPTFDYFFQLILLLFFLTFVSPFGKIKMKFVTFFVILLVTFFYILFKRRVSKIIINEIENLIIIEVSFLLARKVFINKIDRLKILEYKKHAGRGKKNNILRIIINEEIYFEINELFDGWSKKTLENLKYHINSLNKI